MRHKILAYSGGYDSTLLLNKLIMDSNEDEEVVALSCYHEMTGDAKLRREDECRAEIKAFMKKRYPEKHFCFETFRVGHVFNVGDGRNSRGVSQPIFWLANLLPIVDEGDHVYLGYISGDNALVHYRDMQELFNAGLKIQGCKEVGLHMPLRYHTKVEVLKELMAVPGLIDLCTSCESLQYKGTHDCCGWCVPCTHLKEALIGLAGHGEDDTYAKKAREMLYNKFKLDITVTDRTPSIDPDQYVMEGFEGRHCPSNGIEDLKVDTKLT